MSSDRLERLTREQNANWGTPSLSPWFLRQGLCLLHTPYSTHKVRTLTSPWKICGRHYCLAGPLGSIRKLVLILHVLKAHWSCWLWHILQEIWGVTREIRDSIGQDHTVLGFTLRSVYVDRAVLATRNFLLAVLFYKSRVQPWGPKIDLSLSLSFLSLFLITCTLNNFFLTETNLAFLPYPKLCF